MTVVPSVVLTTAQVVGGLVASAKNVLDLAKASSDHTLKASVSELYDSVLDVKARVTWHPQRVSACVHLQACVPAWSPLPASDRFLPRHEQWYCEPSR